MHSNYFFTFLQKQILKRCSKELCSTPSVRKILHDQKKRRQIRQMLSARYRKKLPVKIRESFFPFRSFHSVLSSYLQCIKKYEYRTSFYKSGDINIYSYYLKFVRNVQCIVQFVQSIWAMQMGGPIDGPGIIFIIVIRPCRNLEPSHSEVF